MPFVQQQDNRSKTMKELVVISGKGGTGKTSIVAALASLAQNKVMADCDVDASDLHLILSPRIIKEEDFPGNKIAVVDKDRCIHCGDCAAQCKFDAISINIEIDPISCEGCGVCTYFCPEDAITLEEKKSGTWFISETDYGPMVHARLGIAEDNSGKLVTLVRKEAMKVAKEKGYELIITDGSPGIGCPVISSITGASLVLVVTEPSVSGVHDMKRVVELAQNFKIKTALCINKYDLNNENTEEIENFCKSNNIEVVGRIPYDVDFTRAQVAVKSIVEYSDGTASSEIKSMWEKLDSEF